MLKKQGGGQWKITKVLPLIEENLYESVPLRPPTRTKLDWSTSKHQSNTKLGNKSEGPEV